MMQWLPQHSKISQKENNKVKIRGSYENWHDVGPKQDVAELK